MCIAVTLACAQAGLWMQHVDDSTVGLHTRNIISVGSDRAK